MKYLIPISTGFQPNWREFKDWLKAIPGTQAQFEGKKFKGWLVPVECVAMAEKKAKELAVSFYYEKP